MQLGTFTKLIAKFKYSKVPKHAAKTGCPWVAEGVDPLTMHARNPGQFDFPPNRPHQSHYQPGLSQLDVSLLGEKNEM